MISKVSLRLKLSDFINTDIEEKVMNKINHAHNELHITVLLYLWFEEGEVSKFTTSEKPIKKQKRNDYED